MSRLSTVQEVSEHSGNSAASGNPPSTQPPVQSEAIPSNNTKFLDKIFPGTQVSLRFKHIHFMK